jgi:hypothetical protein
VPLAFFIAILIIGLLALRQSPGDQARAEAQAAANLAGMCLKQTGTSAGHPTYSPTPVPCTASDAAVKVARVLPGTPGSPGCATGETGFSLPYAGVRYPHVLCTVVVAHGG